MIRLVQLQHPKHGRRLATVRVNSLTLVKKYRSAYAAARAASAKRTPLQRLITASLSGTILDYDSIYRGESDWRLRPAFDHPEDGARCLVSGTGLTHQASADNRQAMHVRHKRPDALTDSLRMYQSGLEGGRPKPGQIGVPPEWFYKGSGGILRAHGDRLWVPPFAEDGGEEGEVAGAYVVDLSGKPRRVGLVAGNEFSDHELEKQNYLYLAPSKLRTCAIGPELVVGARFDDVRGRVQIVRGGKTVWSKQILTGERNMSHTVANLEHHHFKYPAHCRPRDAHIHFFGADAFSFGDGLKLQDGDVMEIAFEGFGRPLRNPIGIDRSSPRLVQATPL